MNRREDWDVIWYWQWFRRALWQPYFRDPSHPEGRAARTAPIWTWVLQQSGARRVLDCNCGLGLRAILLREAGFDMVGTDSSPVAVQYAQELATALELDLPFYHCQWQDLGETFGQEFDAVINDAFAWTLNRSELRFDAHNFASVLKPGGVFIFTGADEWSHPEARQEMIEHAWQAAPRFQLRSDYEHDDIHLTLVVAREKTEVGVVENYLFVIRDSEGARLETATICNTMQWTWEDYQAVCREAGFSSLESVKIPVGRREHILNVARK
jgi:SAM-dependent methyltransferase